mmetsp:Transcript_46510/g.92425  ORF Transcript_46510/g.92425 Transcript_46510/m.92425 type:complete len:149 (-) Transcript_46510:950-1396(-)
MQDASQALNGHNLKKLPIQVVKGTLVVKASLHEQPPMQPSHTAVVVAAMVVAGDIMGLLHQSLASWLQWQDWQWATQRGQFLAAGALEAMCKVIHRAGLNLFNAVMPHSSLLILQMHGPSRIHPKELIHVVKRTCPFAHETNLLFDGT